MTKEDVPCQRNECSDPSQLSCDLGSGPVAMIGSYRFLQKAPTHLAESFKMKLLLLRVNLGMRLLLEVNLGMSKNSTLFAQRSDQLTSSQDGIGIVGVDAKSQHEASQSAPELDVVQVGDCCERLHTVRKLGELCPVLHWISKVHVGQLGYGDVL